MKHIVCLKVGMTLLLAVATTGRAGGQESVNADCKSVHAVMVEQRVTVGCKPEHSFCFVGEVAGDHGVRGTTYFRADGIGSRPTTSPDFLPYSGPFEYTFDAGMLIMRETGLSNSTQGNLDSGAITAFQKIVQGTGALAGATGYFFVNGFNRGGKIETTVTGEICFP